MQVEEFYYVCVLYVFLALMRYMCCIQCKNQAAEEMLVCKTLPIHITGDIFKLIGLHITEERLNWTQSVGI